MYDIGADSSSTSDDNLSSDSDLSNNNSLESGDDNDLITSYINNYIKTVQDMPPRVMREVSKIMEIDVKIQKNFQEIDNIKNIMKSAVHSKPELREDLQLAKRKLHRILVLEEMKSTSVQAISSILEESSNSLDEEQSRSLAMKSLDTDTPSPICSTEEAGDDVTPPEDLDIDEDYEASSKKPKRMSSTARGRGRKSSLPPREAKDDDTDSILNSSRGSFGRKKGVSRKRRSERKSSPSLLEVDPPDPEEPRYCSCNEVSYGDMIGCDNNNCPIEWFHFKCVNLTAKPKGKWFCPNCTQDKKKSS